MVNAEKANKITVCMRIILIRLFLYSFNYNINSIHSIELQNGS